MPRIHCPDFAVGGIKYRINKSGAKDQDEVISLLKKRVSARSALDAQSVASQISIELSLVQAVSTNEKKEVS